MITERNVHKKGGPFLTLHSNEAAQT